MIQYQGYLKEKSMTQYSEILDNLIMSSLFSSIFYSWREDPHSFYSWLIMTLFMKTKHTKLYNTNLTHVRQYVN